MTCDISRERYVEHHVRLLLCHIWLLGIKKKTLRVLSDNISDGVYVTNCDHDRDKRSGDYTEEGEEPC